MVSRIRKVNKIYIELLSYDKLLTVLHEERITKNDIIKNANEYDDYEETRNYLNMHLGELAAKIKNDFPEIRDANPNPSGDTSKPGLSTYVNICFKHPDGLTKNEVKRNYNYALRFSDHTDRRKDRKSDKFEVDLIGNRVSDVIDDGYETFRNKLPDIKNKITQFEIKRFGEPVTFKENDRTASNESMIRLRIKEDDLNENLEEIAGGTYCTDYVGDIVNWLLNKPKPYRILYDKKYDVWCIADAMQSTHKDMSIDMFDSDYLYGVANDLDGDIQKFREEGNFNDGYTDAEVYSEWLFDNRLMKGCFFIPNNMNYRDYEESGFYSVNIPITTGNIFVTRASEFSPDGIFKDLYNKLNMRGAIRQNLKQIWFNLRKKKLDDIDDIVDSFHSEAEKNGYSAEEAEEFLNNYGIMNLLTPV